MTLDVLSLMQDAAGYLWLGSANGLQRYDGERFLNFRHDPADTLSISPGMVRSLLTDASGKIWCVVSPSLAINVYHPYDRTFHRLRFRGELLTGRYCFLLDGRVHIISDKGLFRMNAGGEQVEKILLDSSLTVGCNWVLPDASGRIWFQNSSGFQCFDSRSGVVFHRAHNPLHLKILDLPPMPDVLGYYQDRAGNLWFSIWDVWTIFKFNPETNSLLSRNGPAWGVGIVSQFFEDLAGGLWALAGPHICRYRPERDAFDCIESNNNDADAFHATPTGGESSKAIVDRDGGIWIGNERGLHFFHPLFQAIRTIRDRSPRGASVSTPNSFVQTADGDVWANRWTRRITRFDSLLNWKAEYRVPAVRPFETEGCCSETINLDESGRLWVGGTGEWVTLVNASGKKIGALHCEACQLGRVSNILRAKNGDMWLNLEEQAIARWQPGTGCFERWAIDSTHRVKGNYALLEDSEQRIWVGTNNGLYVVDPRQKGVATGCHFAAPPESYKLHNDVASLLEIGPDSILAGTGLGLKLLDFKNKTYRLLPLSRWLPNRYVSGLLRDAHGNIWVSSPQGICAIDPSLTHLTQFGKTDGIIDGRFYERAFFRLRDGRMLAGTTEGNIVVFHPDSLLSRKRPLFAPTITEIRCMGKVFPCDSLLRYGVPLVFQYDQNNIGIFYSCLTYSTPHISFQYQLAPQDKNWAEAGSQRSIDYAGLAPGEYTFRIRAQTPDGRTTDPTAFTLIIRPPWYQTWWFYGLLTTLFLAIIYAVARDRIRRFRERTTYEKRLADLQNQALRAQINPHFIFNALQSVKKFVLLNDVDQAEHYMSRFARLMRQIMDNSREATVSLRRELDLLDNYLQLEQLRFGSAFDFRFEIDAGVQPDDLEVPSMTLQPFVENAVLHGLAQLRERRGLLLIRCSQQAEGLFIEIEDNGVGRARAAELKNTLRREHHHSAGMDITRKRLALFGENARFEIRDVFDAAGSGCGTRAEIWLPTDV